MTELGGHRLVSDGSDIQTLTIAMFWQKGELKLPRFLAMPRESDAKQELRSWREIADEIMREEDKAKLTRLINQLNEAMLAEERQKAILRLTKPK